MGRPVTVARSLTRQDGCCSSNSDRMRRPLARASTRYPGRSGGSGRSTDSASAEGSTGARAADEELAVRRGMEAFLLGDGGCYKPTAATGGPWTAARRVGYGNGK